MMKEPRLRAKASQRGLGVSSREASAVPQCQAVRMRKKRVAGRGKIFQRKR